jgi:hypothetical protein
LALVQVKCAGSNTWKQGEFGHFESGVADPCVTGEIPAFIYAETQATATTANDLIWVYLLEVGTEIEICVTNNGTDKPETDAVIQGDYDLYVASNLHYLDVNASTDDVYRVIKHGSDYDAGTFTATGEPGRVLARILKVQA